MRLTAPPALAFGLSALLCSAALCAQDPPPAASKEPAAKEPAAKEPAANEPAATETPRERTRALFAGTIHPVAGPTLHDGVVLLRGERIVAVGARDAVVVPDDAERFELQDAHLYPGLVDALTDAYTDGALRSDGSLDAATPLSQGLRLRGDRDDALAVAGITTAYVTTRVPAAWRGQGVIVRPTATGFDAWPGKEQAAVQLRMTAGLGPTHPLQRQAQLDGIGNVFEGLDAYKKALADHDKALEKYKKDFADYLAFHQKKKDGDKPATGTTTPPAGEARPDGQRPGPGTGRQRPGGTPPDGPRPRGGGTPGTEGGHDGTDAADSRTGLDLLVELAALLPANDARTTSAQDPPKQDPPKQDPPKQETAGAPAASEPKPPARPQYPKAPPRDPVKDTLLKVLDGSLPLRVEAHRPDELRAALQLQRKRQIPVVVLEQAYGAASVVKDIAAAGNPVVLTEVLPGSLPADYDAFDPVALPAALQRAGVPFAIASGSARRASLLPMMAAAAVGAGLDADAALRAITLTPAEILGVATDTGSLQAGKFADLVVTDRPLFASDCRILTVLGKGQIVAGSMPAKQ